MLFLIIEDDDNKREQIDQYIRQLIPLARVEVASSYQSGLRKLLARKYDLILLDMSMPTFDITIDDEGGRPQAFAGRELLRQMDRRHLATPVIVVTQFERFGESRDAMTLSQLDSELAKAHPKTYCGSVYYNAAMEGWREELAAKIEQASRPEAGT